MNEFALIKKYLKPLTKNNSGSLNLADDIYFDKRKKLSISVDSYIQGIHFLNSLNPKHFVKKIFRSSLSDLYAKGIKPQTYFLSLGLNKSHANHIWLNKFTKLLNSEQKKFKVSLGGGDTIKSTNLTITFTTIGFSKIKPVFRSGASMNDDIYVTGNIGDSFLGLSILKNRSNFGIYNNFFKKMYYEPNIPISISPYLNKLASSSIDISDGQAQDLMHICRESKCGAFIDLINLPLSSQCKAIINKKMVSLKNMFSFGDDYQILFTSKQKNRIKIKNLSKKLNLKITKIGRITKDLNIFFKYNSKHFKLNGKKMGYTHIF